MSGWRSTLVTVVLSAVVGAAAAWGVMQWSARSKAPADLHAVIHQRLNLTPEQDRRLDEVEADFAVERRRLEAELRQANRELSAAIG